MSVSPLHNTVSGEEVKGCVIRLAAASTENVYIIYYLLFIYCLLFTFKGHCPVSCSLVVISLKKFLFLCGPHYLNGLKSLTSLIKDLTL